MKKYFSILCLITLIVVLAACSGGKKEERTFTGESSGITSTYTYVHKGDKVVEQIAKHEIYYEQAGLETKENAQKILDEVATVYQDIEGFTYDIEYGDEFATEKVTIDYTKIKKGQLEIILGETFADQDLDNISMKEIAKELTEAGFTEITAE